VTNHVNIDCGDVL
jgi:hypothetical protein